MTHDKIVNYTRGVALASAPIAHPILYTTIEQRQHLKQSCTCAFPAPHAQKRVPGVHPGSDTTHDPIARHKQRRPNTGETTHRSAYGVVEELELRQGVLELILDTQKRDHSDL